jgi:hypothetical protein
MRKRTGETRSFRPSMARIVRPTTRRVLSHSLLLEKGLIRIGLTLPQNPEFTLSVVHDP